jgi:hypothetical protein
MLYRAVAPRFPGPLLFFIYLFKTLNFFKIFFYKEEEKNRKKEDFFARIHNLAIIAARSSSVSEAHLSV